MTLAEGEKSENGEKWEDEELVATVLVGEDLLIELKLKPEETHDRQCFLLFRGDQLISSDRYSVQTCGNIVQLTLKKSQKDDTGHYSLVAKKLSKIPFADNGTQEGPRRRIRMNVQEASNDPAEGEPPIFVRRLTDLAVKVGTRTRFLVEIRSSSNLKVTWHRNDHPVQEGSRFSFVHEGNFYCVDVAPVMVEDQGHWTCMVENIHGRSSCTSCLSVIVPKAYKPPEFVENLQALLSEGGIVSLECKVIGVPTPVLRWFKDDQEIKAGNVFALTANADDPTSLGIYTCQATNCLGTAFSSSKVHVVGKGSREGSLKPADTLKLSGPLPVFKKILKDESCKIGDTITLSCQIQVPPWPKIITWYNKDGKIEPDDKYHVIEDGLGTFSIEIRGVEAMDEGEWKCVATSNENMKQFSTCYVTMSIPRNYRAPRFMESLKAVLTEEGLVSFECKVVGFPIPLLRWFKDGQELKPGDVYQLTGTNSLGSYCCIARNCMGEARSTAELTVEDIQNQLKEEERMQLLSYNQVPKFIKGLRSCEARIQDEFTFTIQVTVAPEPTLSWYRDDEPIIDNDKYRITREVLGNYHLEIRTLEFIDQAEWKCVAENDFGHSVTSCFLKLIIPKHFKKPKFLESLRAILTEEGAVNLECKVIGVPQPVLTWYKDDAELKPGDIHRITSGQDGTCCLGTYTCKATNCMGSVSSSASLLGFEDKVAMRQEETKTSSSPVLHDLARNLSLSTIHEERTSQLYDTPQTDYSMTMDDKGEVSFSFDGKEVSVSLYETPDLTEEEAIQIVEMYADQLSEHITEGNIIELPPMRFTKETSTTGNLLMEAVVIDVSPDYFAADEEADDLRTEADFEDVSILDDQMQSILSSVGREGSVDCTPVSSPAPRSRTKKKKRSGSDSSNSDMCNKSETNQPKIMDWSESYHSAKEPSFQAQLSVQSQDSVDAFADALSSDELAKVFSRNLKKEIIRNLHAEENVEELSNRVSDEIAVATHQLADSNKEFGEITLMESLEEPVSIKRKRKKKSSKGEIAKLSKTSSEESYTMNADENEPKEKVKRRKSEEKIIIEDRKDIIVIDEKRQESQSMIESDFQKQYMKEEYEIDGEKLSSITSSVFSTAPETSEKLNQKMKLLENLKTLSTPVFILRETLIDLDNVLENYRTEFDEITLHELIISKIVRPIENICEQMSVIENDAIKSAGKKSLIQEIRILLLDSIGGPTEELLRGIELIKSHKSGAHEDFTSDLIVLESLTDPVDDILASLAKIEYGLRSKEERELSIRPKNPIILEKMTRAISQFGKTLNTILQKHLKASGSEEVLCLGERLQCVYQNLDSYILSLPLNKITGALENSSDTLLIESLVRPVENLLHSLDKFSQFEADTIDGRAIYELENSIVELKNKLETLTIALESYEKENEKMGIAGKNLELVNYLKWTMDDSTDKLKKMQQSREVRVLNKVKISQSEEVEPESETIDSKKLQSRRETYVSKMTSLDSISPELDENLPLPEMLLDPLIDVQAKLNAALRHYESQMPPDQFSLPLTELTVVITELRECVSSVAHVATTLNIEDILNHIINLREPLLDLQVAITSSPSIEEYILIEEIIKPLNELNKIFVTVAKSSSISESSKVILDEMSKITDDNLEQLYKIQETVFPELSEKSAKQKATVKPPEELDQMSLTLSSIHFAMSSALEKANEYSYNVAEIIKSESPLSTSSPAYKLISSINILRQSIGDVAVAIASPIILQNDNLEYDYNVVLEELTKLEEPLLNLQKILLTEKHNPKERYILNDIAIPLRALKKSVVEMTKGQSAKIIQLLEDVEKDVALVAMEALKKALIGKIDTEDSSISNSAPGEVPKVVTKWLDPVESWLSSSPEDTDEKKKVCSAINSAVNDLKRQVLKIAIQSSYSEPPSDVALIEELARLKEPLLKVCEVIMSEHNPIDIKVMEHLIQPIKHLLGTVLDVSSVYQANSILQPVLKALEQLENQILLSIQMASYEKDLQKTVAALISEDSEQEKSTSSADDCKKMVSEAKINFEDKIKPMEKMIELESKIVEREESYNGMKSSNTDQQVSEIEESICQSNLEEDAADINDIELIKQQEVQIALAKARIEELDHWSLTLINPLDRLASTTLSLDRSIDEEVHSVLCRPLDSLHKQIELVESQINRPAGQSLENDIETIIEGFLSPMKQVEIALKSAIGIWYKTPAKETVLKFLHDLVESSSDLQQRLDSLRFKLITEAPEQTIQVQKSEASLVETISAVLVPLEGIKEIINNLLETIEDKKDDDTDDLTLIEDHTSTEDVKHIEQATARPLEELIEAIVDPENVKSTSTSLEVEQIKQTLSSSQEEIIEKREEKLAEMIVDDSAELRISELQEKYSDKIVEQEVTTMTTQEILVAAKEQPRVSLSQNSPNINEFMFEELISDTQEQHIQLQENNFSLLIDQHDLHTLLMPTVSAESQQIMEEHDNLILSEIHEIQEIIVEENIKDTKTGSLLQQASVKGIEQLKETTEKSIEKVPLNADINNENFLNQIEEIVISELDRQNALSFKSKSLIDDIDSAVREMMIKCPQICQEHTFEESVRDIVVEELLKVKGLIQVNDIATGDGITIKEENIKQVPEVISQIIFDEKINEIISDEIYNQNIQIINQEGLIQPVEIKVDDILSFSQTSQEIISEDNIQEMVTDKIERQHQIASEVVFYITEGKIDNLIIEQIKKHNIEIVEGEDNLLETVKMRIQEIILNCPKIQKVNILEDKVRDIITDELISLEKNKDVQSKPGISIHTLQDESSKAIATISSALQQKFEETVKNILSKELEKQNIHPTTQEKETFEDKIQNIINSYAKIFEENMSEVLLQQIIIEEVEKYTAEINKSQELNVAKQSEVAKEKIESEIIEEVSDFSPIKLEEHIRLIKEGENKSEKLTKENKILAYSDTIEGTIQMKTENLLEISESLHVITLSELKISDTDHLIEPNEIIITDIETDKRESDKIIIKTQESRQSEFSKDEIKMLVINEIEKKNVQMMVDVDFVNNVADKIQQNIINHPEIIEEHLLEENVQNIVETEMEKKKVDIVEAENLDIIKKEEKLVKELISPIEKESMVLEETVHDMIIEELEKEYVEPSKHKDLLNIIEQRVQNLILMHPDEDKTAKMEGNVQKIVSHTLEDKKINKLDVESLVKAVKQEVQAEIHKLQSEKVLISEKISNEKRVKIIDKENVELSKQDKIIKKVENTPQELNIQHPEVFTADMLDEKVDVIVAEIIKEQEIQVSQVEDFCKAEAQASEIKILQVSSITEEQKSIKTFKDKIESANKKIEQELNLIKDSKAVEVSVTQPEQISKEQRLGEVPKEELEKAPILSTSEKVTVMSDDESKLDKTQEENTKFLENTKQTIKKEEKSEAIDEGKKKIQKTEKPLRRPSQMLAQVPVEIVHDIMREEINKLNIEPSEEATLLKAVEVKIQGMIARYPKVSNIEIQEENVRQIVADQVEEEKAKISEFTEILFQAQKNDKKPKVLGSPATTQIQIPEEIVHELLIDELQKQNIELSQENNLVKAIEIKIYDFIAQHPEISREEILEENVRDIVTEQLEEQKARIYEVENLEKITKPNKATDIFNVPVTTQEQIPEEQVHEMVIDEFHKQNIQLLTEENLVKAVEAKIHDLIAQHPDICKNDIFEESVKDIVIEEWTKQQANVTEIPSNLVEANQQSVQVEIQEAQPEAPKKVENLPSEEIVVKDDDKFDVKKVNRNIEMTTEEKQENNQKPLSPDEDTPKRKSSKGEKSLKQKGDTFKRKSSNEESQEAENQIEEINNQEKVDTKSITKKDNVGFEIKSEESQIEKAKLDSTIKEIKNFKSIEEQEKFKEKIKSSVFQTKDNNYREKSKEYLKKTDKDIVEEINKNHKERNICRRTDIATDLKEDMNIDKKYRDEEITSKKLSTFKFNSDLDFSRSTLKDDSLGDNENRNIPPTIEIDYDDSLSQDLSRRSNASTLSRRHRNLESLEYDDKSHYSSITSRLPTFTPGPRDRGKKPSFCTKLTDRTAAENSRIKLTCTILSDAELEVDWLKDGKILPPSSNKHGIHLENGMASLELYGVKPKDSGKYSCVAKNCHGRASTEAKLKVYSGYEPTPSIPTFTRSIKDTYRKEENTLVLECRVRAQPSPIITWLKDGQVLEMGDRYQQSDLSDGICRLKIFNPDHYDSGLYTCRAENETRLSDRTSHLVEFKTTGRSKSTSWRNSSSSSSNYYDVTGTDKDTGRPRFSNHLTDHSVPAGGTIALQVEVKGVPPPEITWMRADKKGTISVPRARTFADSGIYTLIVPDATELETGTYVCRASNTYGYVDTSANVEVISGSRDGGKPAMFISRPPDKVIIVAVGEDISVSFRAGGVPKPKVIWMKGLTDITNGPKSYKEGHDDYVRLTLKRICASDEGTYCILLKNRYGCDRSFFSIQVKQKARSLTPSPEWDSVETDSILASIHDKEKSYVKQVPGPISSEPIITDGGRNWLALTWGKPEQKGFAPVVAYRVDAWQLGSDGGARWVELGVTPVNTFDAFNLRPGEEYKFRITPRNRYGWGEPVTMTNSVTVREVVKFPEFIKILPGQLKALQGTILSLECEVNNDTTVQVKWYRDTTEIVNGQDSRFTTYFNGIKCSLMIGSLTENDSGRYICEATNTAGRVSTFARVQVVDDPKIVEADTKLRKIRSSDIMNEERPPEFTMRLRDRRVQATYPVRLTCQVTGYPEPEVTWYKYREELHPQNNIFIWNDDAHFHTLEISRSTINDSGIYMARAKNAYGSVSCRCCLVVDKGIRAYIAPEFLSHLDAVYSVKAGGELRMRAQVEAYPTVGITWHRDGHRLRPSRDVVMTLNHDGTVELDLAHITPRDAGIYCCTATNEVGQAETTTQVVLLEKEEISNIDQSLPDESLNIPYSKEPVFITKPLSTEAYEGDTVIISCEVIGDPKPDVMWLRDFLRHDYYKDAPHFRRVGAGPQYRLEIPYAKLDFTGTYSIIAKNCHGQAKAVISLQIYARGQGKGDNGMESIIKHGNVQTLPVIKRPLRDLRCCDGDAISLECKVHAIPEPDVRWEKGGKLIPLGEDFAIDFDGDTARLSIQHVYPEDEGEYTCVAYNDLGKAYTSACLIVDVPEGKETAISRRLTKPLRLLSPNSTPISTPRSTPVRSLSPLCTSKREIKSIPKTLRGHIGKRPKMPTNPKFYAVPHNRVVEEGETVRFQCAIAGHPTPWVIWDKEGISITPTARISLKENDDIRVLEITEVTHEDAGLYRITLENDMGRTEASARLEVIRGRRNSASRSIGTRSASPRTYSIYGSRSNISPSSRCDNSLRPPRFNDLKEKGASSPTLPRWHNSNEKNLTQTGTKNYKITSSLEENKMNPIKRSSSIPRNYRHSQERGKSEPKEMLASQKKVRKLKDQSGKKIKSSSLSSSLSKDINSQSLQGKSFLKSIDKNYKTNGRKLKTLDIDKLKAPVILTIPADVIALQGAKVMLFSTYRGYPKPIVRWLRKGQDVMLDDKTEIETNGGLTCLTLKEITSDEGGKYEIQVENQLGKESRFVNVTVEGPPEPPRDLVIIKNLSNLGEVTLSWRSPVYDGGRAITGYSIEMRKGNEPCWIAVAEAKYSLSHKIQRIDPEETYCFRVRAENIHGLSEAGMESEIVNISNDTQEMETTINPSLSSEEEIEESQTTIESPVVIPEPANNFEERFDVLEELGKGRYGVVRRILNKETGSILAAKFVRTIKAKDKQQVYDEINIMNMLKHPKLLKLVAAFESPKEMIMVTEYISGGELFERVVADDFTLTEKDSILFVRQICQAVEYLHNNKIVHLDLKPENIMCYSRTSHRIKLIDFGLAQTLKPDTPVRVLFGTPEFIPPEIISFEPIGTESDMWSVGVICYVLLTGLSPFMGENDAETFANITRADYDFDDKAFHAISQEAKDFISSLLIKRKELRMSARECLKHAWLAQCAESMSRVALPTDKLKKFIVRRKWQKTGNAIRALGRMAILSANSRKSIAPSLPTPKGHKPESDKKLFIPYSDDLCVDEIQQVLIKRESVQDLSEVVDKSEDSTEERLTRADNTTNECIGNTDYSTISEKSKSCISEDDIEIEKENSKTKITMSEENSSNSERIDDLSEEFITKLRLHSDNLVKNVTDIMKCNKKKIFTVDVEIKPVSKVVEVKETSTNNVENFCSSTSLKVNESLSKEGNMKELTEDNIMIDGNDGAKNVDVMKRDENDEKKHSRLRHRFISFQSNTYVHESVFKPRCQTNISKLDNEDEISGIGRPILSHCTVRTGSVSRTAKMFEKEEMHSTNDKSKSPGNRKVFSDSPHRPRNERIRKAFDFWNK